jgi:hypothetical protein
VEADYRIAAPLVFDRNAVDEKKAHPWPRSAAGALSRLARAAPLARDRSLWNIRLVSLALHLLDAYARAHARAAESFVNRK